MLLAAAQASKARALFPLAVQRTLRSELLAIARRVHPCVRVCRVVPIVVDKLTRKLNLTSATPKPASSGRRLLGAQGQRRALLQGTVVVVEDIAKRDPPTVDYTFKPPQSTAVAQPKVIIPLIFHILAYRCAGPLAGRLDACEVAQHTHV